MPTHVFTLVLDRRPDDDKLAGLQEAGCDDAIFGVENGLPIAEFDREAPTLADAIASAVRDIESTGLHVLRVLDQDLVTLADIADRAGRSRESCSRHANTATASPTCPPDRSTRRVGQRSLSKM